MTAPLWLDALADRAADKAGLLAAIVPLAALFWPIGPWIRRRNQRRNRPRPTIDQASHDRPDAVHPEGDT